MLLLVFSLLCLSDTWKLGLIVIRLFKVSELGCSYWYLTMSNWPGIFWHCLQRVLAKVWEVLLVAGPSISSLIVLKQTWKQGICYFQKWMSSNKARPLYVFINYQQYDWLSTYSGWAKACVELTIYQGWEQCKKPEPAPGLLKTKLRLAIFIKSTYGWEKLTHLNLK